MNSPKLVVQESKGVRLAASGFDLRQRNIDRAAVTGLTTRILTICAQLLTVPLALKALGSTEYGVWTAITSAIGVLVFLDFGIGYGAMGRITEALARNDVPALHGWVRNAYILLWTVSAVFLILLGTVYFSGLLRQALDASHSFLAVHVELVVGFLAIYALVIPCSFVQRLFFAYQQAGWASVMQLVFSLTYLACVFVASSLHWSLSFYVVSYAGCALLVYASFSLWGLRRLLPRRTAITPLNLSSFTPLLADSGMFFLLQTTVALVYNSDQLVLSSFVPGSDLAVYATALKLFSIVVMANGLILGPMWPAIADAVASNEKSWIREAYYRNRRRSMLFSAAACLALAITGNWIVTIWTQGRLEVPFTLLALMATWTLLDGYGQCMAMLLNGMRVVRLQVVVAITLLIAGTAVKVYLAGRIGLYGPILATIMTFLLIVALPETFYINRVVLGLSVK